VTLWTIFEPLPARKHHKYQGVSALMHETAQNLLPANTLSAAAAAAPLSAEDVPYFNILRCACLCCVLCCCRYDNGITGGVISMRNFAEMFFVSHDAAASSATA
jgi:hypothetical protein